MTVIVGVVRKNSLNCDWPGHVRRMQPEKWANVVSPWVLEDGRVRCGGPKCRRYDFDGFEEVWWKSAEDLQQWRILWETYA